MIVGSENYSQVFGLCHFAPEEFGDKALMYGKKRNSDRNWLKYQIWPPKPKRASINPWRIEETLKIWHTLQHSHIRPYYFALLSRHMICFPGLLLPSSLYLIFLHILFMIKRGTICFSRSRAIKYKCYILIPTKTSKRMRL